MHPSLQNRTDDNDAHTMLRTTILEIKCEHASELAGGLVKADCQGSDIDSLGLSRAYECAFLTLSQVTQLLPLFEPCLENHCSIAQLR